MPNPFASDKDDEFFFSTPALTQRLDLIQHLVEFGNQPVLVLGEEGSGKTTLLGQLLPRAGELWRVCHIEAHEALDARTLLEQAMEDYGLYPPETGCVDMAACLNALRIHLDACARSNLIPVLFVDDAHKLPMETLALLLSLSQTHDTHTPPRLTLFSEPALKEAINTPPLSSCREGIMHVLDMPALMEGQTAEYIQQRLTRAGYPQELMPDGVAIHRIYAESGGLPGRIQSLTRQALSATEETPDKPGAAAEVPPLVGHLLKHKWQLATAAGLLAVVSVLVVINSQTGDAIKPQGLEDVPLQLPAPKEISPEEELAMADPLERERAMPYEPLSNEEAEDQVEKAPAPKKEKAAEIVPLKTVPGSSAPSQKPENKRAGEVPAGSKPALSALEKEKAPPSKAIQPAPLPATSPPKALKTPPKPAAVPPPQSQTPMAAAAPPPKEPPAPGRADQYVLQLFGSHDKGGIDDLLALHGLRGRATVMATTRNGRPWYVAVLGPFPDRNKAQAAVYTLPPGVRAMKPWPRTTASLRGTGG
jgi:DamX protein